MLQAISNVQQLSDSIKSIILDAGDDVPKPVRMDALRALTRLENCYWQPGMMQDAYATLAKPHFQFTDTGIMVDDKYLHTAIWQITQCILLYAQHATHNPFDDLFTMEEAAEYLGITRDSMLTYVSRQKRLIGHMIGRSMVFTKHQLDDFNASRRPYKKQHA